MDGKTSSLPVGAINNRSSPDKAGCTPGNSSISACRSPTRDRGSGNSGNSGIVEFQMESLSHISRQAGAYAEDADNTSNYSSDEDEEDDNGTSGGLFSKVGGQALDNIYEIISFGAKTGSQA